MAVIGSGSLVSRSARGAMYQMGELMHVCAVYLGIAVLVTLALSATVPSLREQARQVHAALVLVLRPDGLKGDVFATLGADQSGIFLGGEDFDADDAEPPPAAPPAGGPAPPPAVKPAPPPVAAPPNFSKALSASMAGQPIAGVTPAQAQALRSYIARKYKIAHSVAGALINTAFLVGNETKLDPQLLLAVIAIESRYNPYAESHVGAQGLMQVMTKVHKEKFDAFNEGSIAALNPIANIRVGSQILRDCIKRRGSEEGGLACYVGATGPSDGGYGAKVLAERRRIALASGIPIGR
ncbi:transglycosylase SLT domain-containing protein [Pollutimonas bauzanensis]|uniref:Soluble lytic murein transglycosylase n=1 Tax=Pollutimonas bauzanensis TaxID=658167 RepID=A0A1M5YTC9_9BURK|nr:transglycosylase SLT domain-containing protein [Pollutimonas bauzanensis]SHI15301.1 Soluble lytic murein transglycosylase [Pollutimonas bauzanensis]